MGQVPGFKSDIFISYSRDDNHAPEGEKGWVDYFHDALDSWLKYRRGLKQLLIWRDDGGLPGNAEIDSTIRETLDSTALLFVLHSRNYDKSNYCSQELNWFIQCASSPSGRLSAGQRSRIFHIHLNNIPHQQWPDALTGAVGFPMNDSKEEDELGEFTRPNSDVFKNQLRDIVDAAETILKEMLGDTVTGSDAHIGDQDVVEIFIADTADSQRKIRKRLIADLDEQGCGVISNIPPPWSREEHRQRLGEVLTQAKLSVHLLDQFPGRGFDDSDDITYPHEQATIGLGADIKQIIWIPEDLDIESIDDVDQRHWIGDLESRRRDSKTYEFVRSGQKALSELIIQQIEKLRQSENSADSEQSYLIDTHEKDQQYAFQLGNLLSQNGVTVEFNRESKDPVENISRFERDLQKVHHLILMFGRVSATWLKQRILRAYHLKTSLALNAKPILLENIWVCLTPEYKGEQVVPSLGGMFPIKLLDNRGREEIDPAVIQTLFDSGSSQVKR